MKIIIPMTGKSKRFKDKGISTPKQFLEIEDQMILEHIIKMFPNEKDINLIISNEDSQNKEYMSKLNKFKKFNIVSINFQESGPGGALLESGLLDTEEKVLLNYCDFSNIWDWNEFNNYINIHKPDGIVPAYKNLHPHSVYGNDYAFIKEKNMNILGIQEKASFTNNKSGEYASTGSYYFKSGHLAKKYIEKVFEKEIFINNEVYLSTPFQEMVNDGLKVMVYHIDYFFQWGTPEDYNEFKYNLKEVKNVEKEKKIDLNKINLLVPAAGKSKRFRDKGYVESKIKLTLNTDTVLKEIFNSFKNQTLTKCLILEEDFDEKINFFDVDFIKIKDSTNGQAESASLLVKEIKNDLPILIHSADCILDKTINIEIDNFDIVIFTKENYRRANLFSKNYGWINVDELNDINSFSIKKKPLSENSNVIIGTFLFKNKEIFEQLYTETFKNKKNDKEVHIDDMVQLAFENNLNVGQISSESMVMVGTPIEYEILKYMIYSKQYLNYS